jgi:hypothetical protein
LQNAAAAASAADRAKPGMSDYLARRIAPTSELHNVTTYVHRDKKKITNKDKKSRLQVIDGDRGK